MFNYTRIYSMIVSMNFIHILVIQKLIAIIKASICSSLSEFD